MPVRVDRGGEEPRTALVWSSSPHPSGGIGANSKAPGRWCTWARLAVLLPQELWQNPEDERGAYGAVNPIFQWVPLQNGLLGEPPQRHSVWRFRIS